MVNYWSKDNVVIYIVCQAFPSEKESTDPDRLNDGPLYRLGIKVSFFDWKNYRSFRVGFFFLFICGTLLRSFFQIVNSILVLVDGLGFCYPNVGDFSCMGHPPRWCWKWDSTYTWPIENHPSCVPQHGWPHGELKVLFLFCLKGELIGVFLVRS